MREMKNHLRIDLTFVLSELQAGRALFFFSSSPAPAPRPAQWVEACSEWAAGVKNMCAIALQTKLAGEVDVNLDEVRGPRGMERNGTERNGTEWNGMEWNGTERNGTEWNGMEWNGMERNGTEWNGTEWNGMEWNGM